MSYIGRIPRWGFKKNSVKPNVRDVFV